MKYKNIIFDLDNTLLDFSYAEDMAFRNLFNIYNINYKEEYLNLYRSINEPLWRKLEKGEISKDYVFKNRFSLFFNEIGITVDGEETESLYRQNLTLSEKTIPHAKDVLNSLKKEDYNLYIATNGFSITQRKRLEKTNLMPMFNDVFISEEVGFDKPNVKFFDFLFEHIKEKDKSKLLMIGDNETSDIDGANNFQIDSVLFSEKKNINTNATYLVNDLRDILTIVED
ncbi:YjjG family noncanonical pyrimidine nucleotidase [Peptoniphilus stercorisuis]|uniref:YjjG family noncanonical pyrimidine nucleotidase n=1 Tax=Peptoniphilus stercorisuis TaxID=1436965 RepID=A0ABS4KB65_9FIRM|nr:YjjG family noncanonical pyrimidine nucleotidase [Peptoniphilus stercorisuis]MBP2025008.1 YjjG family noncanonical pyrimidine nucleotidase [Peptoniphilus stercorisuis]